MARKPLGDYEVGYGKPPVDTRFKPGRSGNPNGRPKRQRTTDDALIELAQRKFSIVENGKLRRLDAGSLLLQILFKQAMAGKRWAIEQLRTELAMYDDARIAADRRTVQKQVSTAAVLRHCSPETLQELRRAAQNAQKEEDASRSEPWSAKVEKPNDNSG